MKNKFFFMSMAVIVVMLFIYFRNNDLSNKREALAENAIDTMSLELAAVDIEKNYPSTPSEVVFANNQLILLMYGGKMPDVLVPTAFKKQRLLFSNELLTLNPFEEKEQALAQDIMKNREAGKKIVSFEVGETAFDPVNSKIATVEVSQRTNTKSNYQFAYQLIMEDDLWKILAWDGTAIDNPEAAK